MSALPAPMLAEDGQNVFTGLVRRAEDGALTLCVLIENGATEDDDKWLFDRFSDERALQFAAELDRVQRGSELQ